ncbi:MAG: DUF456 domain-containing protein [Spirochaetaceae bacterium]
MLIHIVVTAGGALLSIAGLVGCVLPIIPGPLLSYAAVVLLFFAPASEGISVTLLIVLGIASAAAMLSDQILPAVSSRRAGAGKAGITGSVIGMLVGMIFFPPFGLVIGAFLGALGGELLFHRDNRKPFKAALGVLHGTLLATLIKLSVAAVSAFFFAQGAIALF